MSRADELIDLELERAKRPQITGSPNGTIEKVGLGYVGKYAGDVTISVSRLRESRDEFTGELTVTCPAAGTVKGTLFWGRFNLMSGTTRNSLAKHLSERVSADWKQMLELFCIEVTRLERTGEPVTFTEPDGEDQQLSYLLSPLLPLGLVTTLYGRNGIGKSTVAAAAAVSIQSGREIFAGWIPLSAPTLMLDWEGDKATWQQRCNAIARGHEIPPMKMAYRLMRRRLVDEVEYLAGVISDLGVQLVVVDSVGLAFGTGHEGADQSEPVLRAFDAMRQIGDVTWLLIDHITGGDSKEGEADKAYGSIYKGNLVRQAWLLMGTREDGTQRQEMILKHKKANYEALRPPQGIVVMRPFPNEIRVKLSDDIEAADLASKMSNPQRLKQLLSLGAQTADYCREQLGMPPNTWRGTLKRMLDSGHVRTLPDGRLGLATPNEQKERKIWHAE